jgi:spore germination cell wall hydrolase CwlJ-like protein
MTQNDWNVALLALVLWREARGEPLAAKQAIACTIRNRVLRPSWWGTDYPSVICKVWQYSSMTAPNDPNLIKWPTPTDSSWQACMQIATDCVSGALEDSTQGATNYFDSSIDSNPPVWAAQMTHVCDIGGFRLYK